MKVTRLKRAQKHLQFYVNNFDFREPFQVLFDGTFCLQALKGQFKILEQLPKYLQCEIKPITTACMIIESEKLGRQFFGTTQLLKTFKVHRCGHERRPLPGSRCIMSLSRQSHYIVATQDRDLQTWVRGEAGIPLLYLHKVSPTLDAPSAASMEVSTQKTAEAFVTEFQEKRLKLFKTKEGLDDTVVEQTTRRKKKGGPNPLSCKKKKKDKDISTGSWVAYVKPEIATKAGKVEKRKRVKIPKHVKEILKQ